MSRKSLAFLLTVLLLLGAALSCEKPPIVLPPSPTQTEPAVSATQPSTNNESNARFTGPPAAQVLDLPPIDFPVIPPPAISAARNLVGTWRGNGISFWVDGNNGARVARTTWDIILIINQQQENTVAGSLQMNNIKQENLVAQNFPAVSYGPDQLENGFVSGTTLDFDIDDWHWTFTFTTDLMDGDYTTQGPGVPCDAKAFKLTRQR